MTYSLAGYAAMVGDDVRTAAYSAALRATVAPGSVVVDLGTGTGFFAILACKLGAARVYAIEPDAIAIAVARETARRNGVQDRIVFLEQLSTEITIPELADVIVSDLRGVLPLHNHHVASIADARDRFLRSGGVLIPLKDDIFAAPVWAPAMHRERCTPWSNSVLDVDVSNWSEYSTNSWTKARVDPGSLVAPAQLVGTLDYRTRRDPSFSGQGSWNPGSAVQVNGFVVWFDATLTDGIGFSCAPWAAEAIYGSAFFPLPKAVALEGPDRITLSLQATLVHSHYVWRWTTAVEASDPARSTSFSQSTFHSQPLDSHLFARASQDHSPRLHRIGEMTAATLRMMDGKRSLAAIGAALLEQFPGEIGDAAAARDFVAGVSIKFAS